MNATPNNVAFAVQARRISSRLDSRGIVTPQRRAQARRNGYRGPVTRADLAKRVSNN